MLIKSFCSVQKKNNQKFMLLENVTVGGFVLLDMRVQGWIGNIYT